MKIVYDSDLPAHRRVQFMDKNGTMMPVYSYSIKLDCGGVISEFSRWGNTKKRSEHREAVEEAMDKEREGSAKEVSI